MTTTARTYVDFVNSSYFRGQLAPAVVDRLTAIPVEREDVRAFIERMFREMRRSGFPATEVSAVQADVLGALLSRLLPGTWEGRVPPITVAGRHRRLDILAKQVAAADGLGRTFTDIACGFPPLTTLDTADALEGWQITGIDRALPTYMVDDGSGNYAVFDADCRATYFQPHVPSVENWAALLKDWDGTRRQFEALLQELLSERTRLGGAGRVELRGASLQVDPSRAYERPALRFVGADLADADVPPADVVRCCNMLLYFDDAFRARSLESLARLVREDGLLICGTDWAYTTEARYFTYRKRNGRLADTEFAFSIDCLVPLAIVPWYTLHDDDRELAMLGTLLGELRSVPAFIDRFTSRSDALRAEAGVCPRGADGYYESTLPDGPTGDVWAHAARLSETLAAEFAREAADLLRARGWTARVNEIGDVAVAVNASS
jgi:SAM-dependent methyltransferase